MNYQKQATDFLTQHGLEFRSVLVGSDCPPFCEDAKAERDMDKTDSYPRKTHIHGKHYRCTISGKDRGHVTFDFWNCYADEEYNYLLKNSDHASFDLLRKHFGVHGAESAINMGVRIARKAGPKMVKAYDLLACIQKYDVGTFHDFCGDFGYDEDSRSAKQVYVSVCKEYQKVRKFFTDAELVQLQEIS
jgi:hypothetical protein